MVPSVHCVDSVEHGKFDAHCSGDRIGIIGGNDRLLIGIKSPLEVYVGKGVLGGGATVGDHVINDCRVSSLDACIVLDTCNSSSFLAVACWCILIAASSRSSR